LPFDRVAGRLPAGMSEADWIAIRPNLRAVAEAADWWDILHGQVARAAAAEDRDFLGRAAEAAGEIDWAEAPWPQLVARLKAERSGKALFHPLRQALTGRDSGPEMAVLLPLIGRDEAVSRLREASGL
jgi:glutamyl-tRNA synthetase